MAWVQGEVAASDWRVQGESKAGGAYSCVRVELFVYVYMYMYICIESMNFKNSLRPHTKSKLDKQIVHGLV